MEHRIQITIRRQGKPVHNSREFKTEEYEGIGELLQALIEFTEQEVSQDLDAWESLEG